MAELSEPTLEKTVGDTLHRRRLVSDILDKGAEFRSSEGDEWYFGPLTVRHHDWKAELVAESPDGDKHGIIIPKVDDAEQVRSVESDLISFWEWWLDEL